jgi:hypothetical protein
VAAELMVPSIPAMELASPLPPKNPLLESVL